MLKADQEYKFAREQLEKEGFPKGLVAFGSARIPYDDSHIQEVRKIAEDCAKYAMDNEKEISFITGGGPSIMTAWLELPHKLDANTGAMALELPFEKKEDQLRYCNPKTSFLFKTFQARKAIMLEYAKAVIIFKGGFGTLDELFEAITLIKTGKMAGVPIFVYPSDFYKDLLNFDALLKAGTINDKEYNILNMFDSKDDLMEELYKVIDK